MHVREQLSASRNVSASTQGVSAQELEHIPYGKKTGTSLSIRSRLSEERLFLEAAADEDLRSEKPRFDESGFALRAEETHGNDELIGAGRWRASVLNIICTRLFAQPLEKGRALKAAALRTHRLVPCCDQALSRFAIVIFQQSTQSLPTAYRAFFRTHPLSVSRK